MAGASPPKKNPGVVRCPVTPPRRPGPGTGTVTGEVFGLVPSVTMVVSDEEEDWKSVSGDDGGHF